MHAYYAYYNKCLVILNIYLICFSNRYKTCSTRYMQAMNQDLFIIQRKYFYLEAFHAPIIKIDHNRQIIILALTEY